MTPKKLAYYISTGLFCAWMVTLGGRFMSEPTLIANQIFIPFGLPAWLVIYHGTAKILGVVAILFVKSALVKRIAYTGFALDFILAAVLHLISGVPGWTTPVTALILMIISYITWNRFAKAK